MKVFLKRREKFDNGGDVVFSDFIEGYTTTKDYDEAEFLRDEFEKNSTITAYKMVGGNELKYEPETSLIQVPHNMIHAHADDWDENAEYPMYFVEIQKEQPEM
jgi:hypothetical protein